MKQYYVIDTPEKMKAVSDPLRIRLMMILLHEEATGKQLADRLDFAASRIHYHLRELEHHGFVEVVRTEEKNGIVQKFYRVTALDFVLSEDMLPSFRRDGELLQEILAGQLRGAISRVYEAPGESFQQGEAGSAGTLAANTAPVIYGISEVKAPRSEIQAWLRKYRALKEELIEMEAHYLEQIRNGEVEDSSELFFLINVGFMTNVEHFRVDTPGVPDGYEIIDRLDDGNRVVKKLSNHSMPTRESDHE